MAEPIIAFEDLRRSFVVHQKAGRLRRTRRVVHAVDGITLQVQAGEACGYIGANGAGKSTAIKMLTGILVPTSGSLRTCGVEPVPNRRRLAREIGVVFGQRSQLWWDLPLRDSFKILAAIHRIPAERARPPCGETFEFLARNEARLRHAAVGHRRAGAGARLRQLGRLG